MKYKAGSRRKAAEYEKALVEWWKKNKIFEKSVEERPVDDSFVFYDGPPFITGMPHHGTLLSSIVKDAVPRYWTMRGKRVERRWGWDCHGLPAENFVEKQLGITDRREIGTKWSLEDYILKARESMVANSETWEGTIDRIGRWVDFKGAYRTMNKDFMESVWWAFKTLYEAGKIYEGAKVLMYDTKFATPVSKSEVTMDNDAYQTVTDPSVYVKFKLKDKDVYLLSWTTTPWTLPGNMALAVNPEMKYVAVRAKKNRLVQIKKRQVLDAVKKLDLPLDQTIVFGSGLLDVLGIRDGNDVDLIVTPEVYNELKAREGWTSYDKLDDLEVCKTVVDGLEVEAVCKIDWVDWYDEKTGFQGLMDRAFNLDGVNFFSLDDLRLGKESRGLEKDLQDVELINQYLETQETSELLILAKGCYEKVLAEYEVEVLREFKGEELVGLKYETLEVADGTKLVEWKKFEKSYYRAKDENVYKVWGADFVTEGEGTGIVQIAPAYGEDDYELGRKNEIPVIDVLDEYGCYLPGADKGLKAAGVRPNEEGQIQIWEANKFIAKCLEENGPIEKIEYIKHEYPFNPRSKQRIMYRAFPSWFFDVQGQKELMIAQNENINWFPGYLKHGRFEKNIEQAPDWNLSRDRFWATAMPVWKGDKGTVKVVGSYDELYELSGVRLEDYHRPWVDEIEFEIDGEHFKRIEKVLDCWFESGSMPFAQLHYPFENKEKFERNYPADFIVEYVGQVRAWFYYVHCVNTALAEVGGFGKAAQEKAEKNAFKNVITTGTLAGNDGRKMSKSLGNYTDPNVLMDQYSADALRFLLLSSPVLSGEDFALTDKDVSDVNRKLAMIWNVYDFFTTYAEVDGWSSPELPGHWDKGLENPLDIWIIARLHQLKKEVINGMEEYNIPKALAGVLPFVDDLSNWFVRRSRRRFWKSEDDNDKAEAYWTLWKVLSNLARILAPFTPFLAEELWQKTVGGDDPEMSVHLQGFPTNAEIDEEAQEVLRQMARVREVINEGLMLRMRKSDTEEQVKVRQPLQKLVYAGEELPEWGIEIVKDEVNVKEVERGEEAWIDKEINEELAREGFVRELIRAVQAARKKAGLNVDDRIKLSVSCEVPEEWMETLRAEVLAEGVAQNENYVYDEIAKVAGENVTISLEKA